MRSTFLSTAKVPRRASAVFGVSALLFTAAMTGFSQAPMAPMGKPAPTNSGDQNKQLADQVAELRAQVAKLQAAQRTGAKPMGGGKSMGMGMKEDQSEMGGMAPAGDPKMAAPTKAMGMCCMGEMGMPPGGGAGMGAKTPPGMAGMSGPSSAMPGQAGASHLLHVGSTGFFLNHSQHITLTADQKSRLNRLKEKAMLEQASGQRKVDQAEQELYTLTGADQVDNSKVEAKVSEIEKMRSGQRMSFIRAVGEASNVLTNEQRQALMGTMPASQN